MGKGSQKSGVIFLSGYLSFCRSLNERFSEKVRDLLTSTCKHHISHSLYPYVIIPLEKILSTVALRGSPMNPQKQVYTPLFFSNPFPLEIITPNRFFSVYLIHLVISVPNINQALKQTHSKQDQTLMIKSSSIQ